MTISKHDWPGGFLIASTGAAYSIVTLTHYDLWSGSRVGPGLFPLILGVILFIMGATLVVLSMVARFQQAEMSPPTPRMPLRNLALVLLGLALFAVLLRPAGMAPAIFTLVLTSSLAERPFRPLQAVIVAAVLCAVIWLVFGAILGFSVTMLEIRI